MSESMMKSDILFLVVSIDKSANETVDLLIYPFKTQSSGAAFGLCNAWNGVPRISLSCALGELELFAFDVGF